MREHIFLDANYNAKIGDFGFSTQLGKQSLTRSCGTKAYAAPELLRGDAYMGPPSDIWSLGVVLFRNTY